MEMILPADMIVSSESNRELLKQKTQCDKYDYLAAAGAGVIGGIVDIFLVGNPKESVLDKWTESQTDQAVKRFAKWTGWSPKKGNQDNVASAIGFLEKKFPVNYDQRYAADVNGALQMSTKNHHMKSLSHSTDIIGLFFSILNQFTSTASFLDNGKLITIKTDTYELQGSNFVSKVFCGMTNWFGHVMSDVAGSSGARQASGGGRGSGLAIPFYELFGLCTFGKFDIGKDKQDLATLATRAFQEGYDLRHGMGMAIPVLITDFFIRLIWVIRCRFVNNLPLKECMPTIKNDGFRTMLLLGNGALCTMDLMHAMIKSGGNVLTFFMNFNLIAWSRFVILIIKDISIRIGLTGFDGYIESFKIMNEALLDYLNELKQLDIKSYRAETTRYNQMVMELNQATSSVELGELLMESYDRLGLTKPWQGDFDVFMSDKNNQLEFD